MKLLLNLLRMTGAGVLLLLGLLNLSTPVSAAEQPRIRGVRIEGGQVLVTAEVPPGLRKITLESRARLGRGAWMPRGVVRLDGRGGEVVFRLEVAAELEMLRVRADETEPLPESFYQGSTQFAPQPGAYSAYLYRGDFLAGGLEDVAAPGTGATEREVVESDIWKLQGTRLYFFNQYRGLQIIDVSDPAESRVVSTVSLPAAGEQMYLLGETHAVLLVRDDCAGGGSGAESAVVVVAVDDVSPRIVARVPVTGRIQESRLVGQALYVASETYRSRDPSTWEWGTVVTAFDLADPAAPIRRGERWYAGYGHTVAATPGFFFVATADPADGNRSLVQCLDITAPDGQIADYATVRAYGRVADKFKLDWSEGVLRVVSEASGGSGGTAGLVTRLETFRLPHPASAGPGGVAWLGGVDLGHGERLFATRFDGARAYVVTYRQVDPLWVVDLSDPQQPRIAGELQVPGWSTYIQPLGTRLLSMGIDDVNGRRVAVSLFDVADPAKPALLKRVSLGDQYSWSEANQTEKAFTVLPEEQLVLVPFEGTVSNAWSARLQLIDFDPATDRLELRGTVATQTAARRAAWHEGRILALSGTQLLSVEAADRDQPVVQHTLPLIWSVDRVLLHGEWLVQIGAGDASGTGPVVRVAPGLDPDRHEQIVTLPGSWPVVAAGVREGRLFVVQASMEGAALNPEGGEPVPNLRLTVFDLEQLPEWMPVLGSVEVALPMTYWWGQFQVVWPKPGLLVLAGGEVGWGWPWWFGTDALWWGMPMRWSYWGGAEGASRLFAFDVSDPARPVVASTVDLTGENRMSFSRAFVAGGRVHVSHSASVLAEPQVAYDASLDRWVTNPPPTGLMVYRHYLDVVDYADAAEPTVRKPVEIPGRLEGLDRVGGLLFTTGAHWVPDAQWNYDGTEWIDASAYDGVEAHLVASLKLPSAWPHPVRVYGGAVVVGQPADSTHPEPGLQVWGVSEGGQFELRQGVATAQPIDLLAELDGLLVSRADREVRLFESGVPGAGVKELGSSRLSGCLWYDLGSAAADREQGVYVPLGYYGVGHIPVTTEP